jgi:hypothetical protein
VRPNVAPESGSAVDDDATVVNFAPRPGSAQARQRRLADVFGDVLPDTTSDEQAEGGRATDESDLWYHQNRPPHHERD